MRICFKKIRKFSSFESFPFYLFNRDKLTILIMKIKDPMSLTTRLNLNSRYCKKRIANY